MTRDAIRHVSVMFLGTHITASYNSAKSAFDVHLNISMHYIIPIFFVISNTADLKITQLRKYEILSLFVSFSNFKF